MKKIKIGYSEQAYTAKKEQLTALENKLSVLKEDLLTNYDIKPDNKMILDCISGGRLALKKIEKDYLTDSKAVKMTAAKEAITAQYEAMKSELINLIQDAKELQMLFNYGTLNEEGKFIYNQNLEKVLTEECTKYLTDADEIALYEAQEEGKRAFYKFRSLINSKVISSGRLDLALAHMIKNSEQTDYKLLTKGRY